LSVGTWSWPSPVVRDSAAELEIQRQMNARRENSQTQLMQVCHKSGCQGVFDERLVNITVILGPSVLMPPKGGAPAAPYWRRLQAAARCVEPDHHGPGRDGSRGSSGAWRPRPAEGKRSRRRSSAAVRRARPVTRAHIFLGKLDFTDRTP